MALGQDGSVVGDRTLSTWDDLQQLIREFNEARDWQQYHDPKSLCLALMGEMGELAAHFQWLTPAESDELKEDPVAFSAVRDEVADVTIYLLTFADRLGIELPTAVLDKINANDLRYPEEKAKGRNLKHDQL